MWCVLAVGVSALLGAEAIFGNGGPFVVKYPKGDPAAKGVLARLDPSLKPRRETRLHVVKEDLTIDFLAPSQWRPAGKDAPLVDVRAAYAIQNPTDKEVVMDFGFPILRGVYMSPGGMEGPMPAVGVTVENRSVRPIIISNSAIYGVIRQRARRAIDAGVKKDPALAKRVAVVKAAASGPAQAANAPAQQAQTTVPDLAGARKALADYLVGRQWTKKDAALMVEYACLDLGRPKIWPRDSGSPGWWGHRASDLVKLRHENLGVLAAIGEQKTTQFFARLAGRFDPKAASAYKDIFTAWGGNVQERSVDLTTGKVRPREVTLTAAEKKNLHAVATGDPSIYARVAYFDEKAKISKPEKAACLAVLKNLPVVFTFSPMNLLYYRVTFPAGTTRLVTVSYKQYAYTDTHGARSHQLAYVLHPASLWDTFGPINVKIRVPQGVKMAASVSTKPGAKGTATIGKTTVPCITHEAALTEAKAKQGELFVAVDAAGWRNAMSGAGGAGRQARK